MHHHYPLYHAGHWCCARHDKAKQKGRIICSLHCIGIVKTRKPPRHDKAWEKHPLCFIPPFVFDFAFDESFDVAFGGLRADQLRVRELALESFIFDDKENRKLTNHFDTFVFMFIALEIGIIPFWACRFIGGLDFCGFIFMFCFTKYKDYYCLLLSLTKSGLINTPARNNKRSQKSLILPFYVCECNPKPAFLTFRFEKIHFPLCTCFLTMLNVHLISLRKLTAPRGSHQGRESSCFSCHTR